jgi:RNA-directed DNA polymerase
MGIGGEAAHVGTDFGDDEACTKIFDARDRAQLFDGGAKGGNGGVHLRVDRFAQRHAGKRGRKRPETIYFLGLTLYCTRNRKGNFKVGMRTEKSRLRRSLMSLQELMRQIRHHRIGDQVSEINAALRGHYAYYGVAGNIRSLQKVYRVVERYWLRMLRSRSWATGRLTWDTFNQIKQRKPLLRPKLRLPYQELQTLAVL